MDEKEIIEEFQKRRKIFLRKSAPAVVLMIGGFVAMSYLGDFLGEGLPLKYFFAIATFTATVFGILWLTHNTYKIYRCPACNAVPMGGWLYAGGGGIGFSRGVDLNPRSCPKCGVHFKPEQ